MDNGKLKMDNVMENKPIHNGPRRNVLMEKVTAFSVRMVKAEQYLKNTKQEKVMSKQILRSGTSIGANCTEAQNAQSKADFINKLSIALKEADETKYWLHLLKEGNFITDEMFNSTMADIKEICALLVTIIKTTKSKM